MTAKLQAWSQTKRRNVVYVVLVMVIGIMVETRAWAQHDPSTGKIIEWGWGTPPPVWVHDHIEEMEKLPFDGLVMNLFANGHHDPSKLADRQASFTIRSSRTRTSTRLSSSSSKCASVGGIHPVGECGVSGYQDPRYARVFAGTWG